MINHRTKAFFNPEQFQGWGKKRKYFEGWYYKIINSDESKAFAIIPGIAMDETGKKQAFVQILDGKKRTAEYHKFEFERFEPTPGIFKIAIAENSFSDNSININLPNFKGELNFKNIVPWPKPWYSPGIMGPYAFAPFMECYHGIVSMDHSIHGKLEIDGETIDFENGRGYIEKDWGRSFPGAYTWMQSNHFSKPGISVKASVATIPWISKSFVGFIAGIWIYDRLIKFTTYNRTLLRSSKIDSGKVELVLENRNYRLEILAKRDESTTLASPIRGFMDGRIEESMTAVFDVNLTEMKNKQSIFMDSGRNGGLEVAGKIDQIII